MSRRDPDLARAERNADIAAAVFVIAIVVGCIALARFFVKHLEIFS